MRIVQVVTQMEAGGAQRVAMLLAEGLRKRGYEVETWFLYLKRPTYIGEPGTAVLLDRQAGARDYPAVATRLIARLRAASPDAVITHTHYANVLGQSAAVGAGIRRRVAVQHNPPSTYPTAARWADRLLGAVGTYTTNICVSRVVAESMASYPEPYRRRLRTVYNGVPAGNTEHAEDVRARFEIPPEVPLLVNVGRLSRQKNQRLLFQALRVLPEAHLALAGDGELREQLVEDAAAAGVRARTHFLGEQSNDLVCDLLRSSQVFVFPSIYEAMPIAVIEALRAGLPVVASDIPSLREVLDGAGLLVPAHDAAQFAATVRRVLDEPELARNLSRRSLERVQSFSVERMLDGYEEALHD